MDIRKIELFVDLAKTMDYTTTADNLFTTQGNVSKAIISLEKELDVCLFDRSHRKISLTKEGQIALEYATKVLQDYEKLQKKLQDYQRQKEHSLTLLFIPTAPDYQGFTKISNFIKTHPDIKVEMKEVETCDIEPLLTNYSNTVAFTRTRPDQTSPSAMEIRETEKDEFVVILPANHPLAKSEIVELAQLKEERFLLQNENSMIYPKIIELCAKADFVPNVTYKGVRNDILLSMVEKELGISILMRKSIQRQLSSKVVMRQLAPTNTSFLSFISPNLEQSKAVRTFFEELK